MKKQKMTLMLGLSMAVAMNSATASQDFNNPSKAAAQFTQNVHIQNANAVNVDLGGTDQVTVLNLNQENVITANAGTNGVSTVAFMFFPHNGMPLNGITTIDSNGNVRNLSGWWQMVTAPVVNGKATLTLPQRAGKTVNVQWTGW